MRYDKHVVNFNFAINDYYKSKGSAGRPTYHSDALKAGKLPNFKVRQLGSSWIW